MWRAVMSATGEPLERTVVVEAKPQSVRAVRGLARAHALALALTAERTADVELAVSELVTNAVEYGDGTDIHVTIVPTEADLTVAVRSTTDETRSASTAAETASPSTKLMPHSRAGRGLRIVASVADEVTIASDGPWLTVSCRFAVRAHDAALARTRRTSARPRAN